MGFICWFFSFLLMANVVTGLMVAQDSLYVTTTSGGASLPFVEPSSLLVILNVALIGMFILLRMEYLQPASRIAAEASRLKLAPASHRYNLKRTAQEFSLLIQHALSLRDEQDKLHRQFTQAQLTIETLMRSHRRLNHGAFHETLHVFRTIQSYAQYLEDMVLAKRADETVRYDYDEVCEAAGNLQFLMEGMSHLLQEDSGTTERRLSMCDAGSVLGQFLVHITPSLERRAMRITSRHFPKELFLYTQEPLLRHLLWALLYVCLRYAEDDSTLNIEGKDGRERVTIRFFVTHSNPAALSVGERDAYLSALTNSDHSIHMFAHALSQHPNMQIASKLAAALNGVVDCVPQGPYCCMLELTLPKLASG